MKSKITFEDIFRGIPEDRLLRMALACTYRPTAEKGERPPGVIRYGAYACRGLPARAFGPGIAAVAVFMEDPEVRRVDGRWHLDRVGLVGVQGFWTTDFHRRPRWVTGLVKVEADLFEQFRLVLEHTR